MRRVAKNTYTGPGNSFGSPIARLISQKADNVELFKGDDV